MVALSALYGAWTMASYNVLERWAARTLARFPRAYTSVKRVYQRVNYLAFRDRKVRFELHTRARLLTPMGWGGVAAERGVWFLVDYRQTPGAADMEHFLLRLPLATGAVTRACAGWVGLGGERVAVLDGEPSGVGEWAVQSTGPKTYEAKIVFTLPADPTFRTLVLGVSADLPVRIARGADSGLIESTPLELSESDECG